MARSLVAAPDPAGAAQPNLFDVDDPALDTPVPYVLTVRGRRAVDPEVPRLQVVPSVPDAGDAQDADAVPDPRADDRRLVDDLDHTGSPRHARARALVRSGTPIEEVAADLGVHAAVVRVWLAEPSVPARIWGAEDRSAGEDRPVSPGLAGEVAPVDVQGLALLAACGTIEPGAVVATTPRIAVAEAVVAWLRTRHGVSPGQVRVILQVADRATADLVARAWADRLDLTPDRVSTVEWRRAPSPRGVQASVRVTGRDLAVRVGAQLDAWPVVGG